MAERRPAPALLAAVVLLCAGCGRRAAAPPPADVALFEDVAAARGIRFVHDNGFAGKFHFLESNPGGVALFDMDGDDDLDLFFVQSGPSERPETVANRPHGALYRNDGKGNFTDVTAGSGLDVDLGYGHGAATGDVDNDGDEDLLVTGYRSLRLMRNDGGGKFADVTRAWGLERIHSTGMAMSAAFGDYDLDGRLDLYVGYYGNWSHDRDKECADAAGDPEYCTPDLYDPDTHRLWHNVGGRFEDVSARSGIARKTGRGLAVAWLDADRDGRPDIFVANDMTPNFLWRNNGDGTFTDIAVEAGCAYNADGAVMAGMGVAPGDIDHTGAESFTVTDFSNKINAFFQPVGPALYEDRARKLGRDFASTLKTLSFGCALLDMDADGWLDLAINNGHVNYRIDRSPGGLRYREPKQLFRNRGDGTFAEVTGAALGPLSVPHVGRGLARGDFDNDGRVDLVAVNQNAAPQLLRNRDRGGNHWVSLRLVGVRCNRDAEHARVVLTAGGTTQSAVVRGGFSYLSASDRRVYFGLGKATSIERVEIFWPGGGKEVLRDVAVDTFHTVTQGKGITARRAP